MKKNVSKIQLLVLLIFSIVHLWVFLKNYLFLILAVLGLHCCMQAFSS